MILFIFYTIEYHELSTVKLWEPMSIDIVWRGATIIQGY